MTDESTELRDHFIRKIIREDLASGKIERVVTRFPPEPNGYLHIGHVKPICLNFTMALENAGACHLRFDDTNPIKEETRYVEGMQEDIRWLGFDWGDNLFFASDYFAKLYEFALQLIERGHAFVCDLSSDEIAERRGTLTEPGIESPYRSRPVDENLDLFRRMKAGEFEPGERVVRAKIDMASPVLPNRDPILYRILKASHHRTGDEWCIYPMYDFAHSLSDAIEGITHSLCGLEFVDRRPLYDWIVEHVDAPSRPYQYEFSELNITQTVLSKRFLRRLVEEGTVTGWDDPRMPTLAGYRRRGVPPESLRNFYEDLGIARSEQIVQFAQLEHHIRSLLNETSPRVMAVLRPLKLVIENYPEDGEELLDAVNNPQDESAGTRQVPFSRELYIERDDFLEDPPRKFFRLAPGREVRLRYAYFVTCTDVVKDESGEIVEVRCTYDPATKGGDAPDGRKVKGTLHWVSARHALGAEARLYEQLFLMDDPTDVPEDGDFMDNLNPASLETVECFVEPSLGDARAGDRVQFERLGYFCVDPDSADGRLVFNRTATLRDTWGKVKRKG